MSKIPTPPKPSTAGRIIINCVEQFKLCGVEITPAGKGQYAITIRQVLTNQLPQMFKETYKGSLTIIYLHPAIADMRLSATFLDFGIEDQNGESILSLYFRGTEPE
jgi:hypothetical protein